MSNVTDWSDFKIKDIFKIINGKGITLEEIEENPGNIPAIQGGESNNGILGKMSNIFIGDKNYCYINVPFLSLARVGSSGCINLQNKGCYIGDKSKALIPKQKLSIYCLIFLKPILNCLKNKFSYGKGVRTENYNNLKIKLPTDKNGNPDWEYMENYIKSLPYSKYI